MNDVAPILLYVINKFPFTSFELVSRWRMIRLFFCSVMS